MKNRCETCKFWELGTHFDTELVQDIGECSGLLNETRVEIELHGGWDGCVISKIETDADFSCGNWVEIDE
jgi:hypothetical protein